MIIGINDKEEESELKPLRSSGGILPNQPRWLEYVIYVL